MASAGRLVVGYEGGSTGADALAFARRWARASGDELLVVTVHPGPAPLGAGRVDVEWVAYEREQADTLLDQARALVPEDLPARFVRVDSGSAAHGLHDLVEQDTADIPLVVLGSGRHRGLRRTYPGTTAERLLQGSPAPVAMVPWGYADGGQGAEATPLRRVAVAFVDTPDGHHALAHAERMARHLAAELLVVSVVPDTLVQPSLGDVGQFGSQQATEFRSALDAAVAGLPAGGSVRAELRPGPVVDALTELRPEECDVLVVGSRGYGPLRSVLLGGVSSRVVKHSRVPVVVVPRGG
jgi:nucleotide-binding universal stress UspA family protein